MKKNILALILLTAAAVSIQACGTTSGGGANSQEPAEATGEAGSDSASGETEGDSASGETGRAATDEAKSVSEEAESNETEMDTPSGENAKTEKDKTGGDSEDSSDGTAQAEETYQSSDGFQVRYDSKLVEETDIDEHSAKFVYTGESAGTNMLTISYIPDKQPEEALYDLTSSWGDQEKIGRSEGFFPGTDDKWGYWRTLSSTGNDSGLGETAVAGEYNGGVLMFEIISHMGDNDKMNLAVNDTISAIIDSITYDDFAPQTMFSYVPGTYVSDEASGGYTITLKQDHNAELKLDKKLYALWGSITLFGADFSYDYTIEGDNLYLEYDGKTIEFHKVKK